MAVVNEGVDAVAVAVAGVICMLALAALGRNRNDGGAVTPKD